MRLTLLLIALLLAKQAAAGLPYVQCRMPAAHLPESEAATANCADCAQHDDAPPLWVIECARDEFKQQNYCLMQQNSNAHRNAGLSLYRDQAPSAFLVVGASLLLGDARVSLWIDDHPPASQPAGQPFRLDKGAPLLDQLRRGERLSAALRLDESLPADQTTVSLAGFAAAYDRMGEALQQPPDDWPLCSGPPAAGACCKLEP